MFMGTCDGMNLPTRCTADFNGVSQLNGENVRKGFDPNAGSVFRFFMDRRKSGRLRAARLFTKLKERGEE